MAKRFDIHEWQAKYWLKNQLNDDYYDKASDLNRKDIEHKLEILLDKTPPSPKNIEARQGIKAALNSNNVVMMKKALDHWSEKLAEANMTGTGGGVTPGNNMGYMTPNAFKKKRKNNN